MAGSQLEYSLNILFLCGNILLALREVRHSLAGGDGCLQRHRLQYSGHSHLNDDLGPTIRKGSAAATTSEDCRQLRAQGVGLS